MWKNFVERGGPQMTKWRMRIACWIPKATHTHWKYVILITLPLQQWLQECARTFSDTYIACLVRLKVTLSYTGNTKYKTSANGVLRTSVYWRFQAILSFKNVTQFQGTRVSAISFTPIRKYGLPWADFQETQILNSTTAQISDTKFHPNRIIMWEVGIKIYLHLWIKYGLHWKDLWNSQTTNEFVRIYVEFFRLRMKNAENRVQFHLRLTYSMSFTIPIYRNSKNNKRLWP